METDNTESGQPGDTRRRRGIIPENKGKRFGYIIVVAGAFAATFFFPGIARPFHSGGVGYCEGCHSLHNSNSGTAPAPGGDPGAPAGTGSLLTGKDAGSTCLRCHSEAGAGHNVFSQNGSSYTPGGDFAWLKKTFHWTDDGKGNQSPGESQGHSVVAIEYGLTSDVRLSIAPGGTYPATTFSCISCHDPHGKVSGSSPAGGTIAGNYRLLGGAGYDGGGSGSGVAFTQPAPVAVANRVDWKETETNHPDYGSGMSEWCVNCHAGMASAGIGLGKSHPAGNAVKLGSGIVASYNAYVKTGDMSGSRATAFLALVPFERGTSDASLLHPSSTEGPDENANVMCLTCHRAHASAFASIGRWDFRATFIAESHPNDRESYYGRDMVARFGRYQRSFCNKCHTRD